MDIDSGKFSVKLLSVCVTTLIFHAARPVQAMHLSPLLEKFYAKRCKAYSESRNLGKVRPYIHPSLARMGTYRIIYIFGLPKVHLNSTNLILVQC